MFCRSSHLAIAAAIILLAVPTSFGDVFLLVNGGRIVGRWLNPQDEPLTAYDIEMPEGGRLRLKSEQVKHAIRQRPAELDFERIAPTYADTVEDQWRLAEWCRAQRLGPQRETVLERILELDPDHTGARYALGYQQLNGQWVTIHERRKHLGYVWYRGRYRLAQDVELLEADRKRKAAQAEWAVKLRRWREELSGDKAARARAEIQAINDANAVQALTDELRQEPFRAVRLLYLEALGRIASPEAVQFLIFASLNDLDEEIRVECVDQVVALQAPGTVEKYLEHLKDKNNVRINLAAKALGQLGDPSAVGPLIDVLVTTHTVVLSRPGRTADTVTTSFQKSSGGSSVGSGGRALPGSGTELSTGNQQQIIRRTVPNSDVLSALVQLTGGVNFSFDQRAWRYWLAAEQQRPQTQFRNARRD